MAFFLYPYVRPTRAGIDNSHALSTPHTSSPSADAKSGNSTLLTIQKWANRVITRLLDFGSHAQTPGTEIRKARAAFHKALSDVHSPRAFGIRYQIEASRTLSELWHLRADVFRTIADGRGEGEAKDRVSRLDHHFPRGPRRAVRDTRSSRVTAW